VSAGGGPVDATIDSEYRFANALWVTAGLLTLWAVPRIDDPAGLFGGVLGLVSPQPVDRVGA
jgi:hypothetical protein